IGADAVERRVTKVELPGIAENEVEADGEHDIERADGQVRAPIRILKRERQDRDDDRGNEEPPAPVTGLAGKRRLRLARHSLHAFRRSARSGGMQEAAAAG